MTSVEAGELIVLVVGTIGIFWVAGGVLTVVERVINWIAGRLKVAFGPVGPRVPRNRAEREEP